MSQSAQNGDFHRADPAYRRTMQIWLVACVAGGALLLLVLNVWLDRLYSTLAHSNLDAYQHWMNRLLAGLCVLLGIGMAAFGLWLQGLARQTRQERRWPPSAMRTSTDVRIRYLTSADALVQQMLAGAWLLWLLAAGLAAWAGWLLFVPI
jgi:hypothetical protein